MNLLRLILDGELEDRLRELLPVADTSDTADTHQKLNLKKGLPSGEGVSHWSQRLNEK